MTDRLDAQFAFLNEADRLKSVLRATTLCDGSRRENSGEHSWHLALYALVLAEQAAPGVDINRVIRMLLIHDPVSYTHLDVYKRQVPDMALTVSMVSRSTPSRTSRSTSSMAISFFNRVLPPMVHAARERIRLYSLPQISAKRSTWALSLIHI